MDLRPVQSDDLKIIERLKLRDSDQKELMAATGLSPQEALLKSVTDSKEAWVIVKDGKIEGVCGVTGGISIRYQGCYGIP